MKRKKPASKIRDLLEKLKNGEDIGPCRTVWTKPLPDGERPYIDMSMTEHFNELNDEIKALCDTSTWEPPEINNAYGFKLWVEKGLSLAEGSPVLEAQMLKSVFDVICKTIDDKTSKKLVEAICSPK